MQPRDRFNMKQTLGFIGIGSMGAPIVRNLLRQGHGVVVFDIDRTAVDALEKTGAGSAVSPTEVASAATIIFLCLPSVEAIGEAAYGAKGIDKGNKGRTCINLST